jgi:hypothetical protein
MKFTSTHFKAILALFLFFQNNIQAQITDDVIIDRKFWATGKLKPVSMVKNERDAKVVVKLEEDFNSSVWNKTSVDSSKLDNSCNRFFAAKYVGSLTTPLRLNVTDSFVYFNNRVSLHRTNIYNFSTNPVTLSSQRNENYFYVAGSTRTEPDSIVSLFTQGSTNTANVRAARFDASNRILDIVNSVRNGAISTPQTRVAYKYGIAGLTNVSTENWSTATNSWVSCTTCENILIVYDNIARISEQVQKTTNGDSVRYLLSYYGVSSRVRTITKQVKTMGTTAWVQESIVDNIVQNAKGYPTYLGYFDGGDSIRISYQYLADTSMTQQVISVKNGGSLNDVSRITQTYCTPCTNTLPVIQAQPNPTTTAYVGQAGPSFGISGTNIFSFQWQVSTNNGANWTDINPADTTTYLVGTYGNLVSGGNFVTIKAPTLAQNGHRFRVIVSNGCGSSVTSSAGILSVQNCADASPTLQGQSTDITRYLGQNAVFSVTATNVGTTVGSYEWFYYLPNDTINRNFISFNDTTFTGQGTNTLTLKFVKPSFNGYRFRCNLRNGCAPATPSNLIRLTALICPESIPTIQTQPSRITVDVGTSAVFTVASNTPTVTFSWQVKTPATNAWITIPNTDSTYLGSQTNTLTLKYAKLDYERYGFRCIASTCAGTTPSDSVFLSVRCPGGLPTAVSQASSVTTNEGTSRRIDFTGTNIATAQWQVSTGNSGIFNNILATDTTYTIGATSATNANITIKYPKVAQNGFRYRVIITNSCGETVTSAVIALVVNPPCNASAPTIQTQPSNITVNADAPATFAVASNTPTVTFSWQVKLPTSGIWTTIPIIDSNNTTSPYTGQRTNTLTLTSAKYANNQYRYRCNVSTCAGTITSDSVLLTVRCPGGLPIITSQVASVMTTVGTPRRIDVTGTNIVGAQWQVSNTSGGAFNNILATDTTYTIGATTATNANITIKFPKTAQNGFRYRVILTNSCSDSLISTGTSLVVNFPSSINELDAKVRVYPNPTDNLINIDLPMLNFKVTLMDSKGSVILKSENSKQISLEELPTGIYFLNLKTIEGETTKKVIKY